MSKPLTSAQTVVYTYRHNLISIQPIAVRSSRSSSVVALSLSLSLSTTYVFSKITIRSTLFQGYVLAALSTHCLQSLFVAYGLSCSQWNYELPLSRQRIFSWITCAAHGTILHYILSVESSVVVCSSAAGGVAVVWTAAAVADNTTLTMKKELRETQTLRAGCSRAEQKIFTPPQTTFPGAHDGQNLISWRLSLPSPTTPVWWRSMHAISSYHGNSPTNKQTHKQTGPTKIHWAANLSAQSNYI